MQAKQRRAEFLHEAVWQDKLAHPAFAAAGAAAAGGEPNTAKEMQFFLSIKTLLTNNELYCEFLTCLSQFTEEMIGKEDMMMLIQELFGAQHAELFEEFKQFLETTADSTSSSTCSAPTGVATTRWPTSTAWPSSCA